jgi:murein DD-endopeptidase MepM/ murein hydrolase activator NlpD
MKRTLILLAAFFLLFASVAGAEKILIDSHEIHTRQGKPGKWVRVESKGQVYYYAREHGVTYQNILALNDRAWGYPEYIFVPYSEEVLERLKKEGITRKEIESSRDQLLWPILEVDHVTSSFGIRHGELHAGIDLPLRRGAPIIASMDGRVVSADYSGGHGKTIYIEHRNRFYTRYSHCHVMFVSEGDLVKKGQIIGLVGSTGNSTGNHLHYEVRYNHIPLDPLDFLPEIRNLKTLYKVKKLHE